MSGELLLDTGALVSLLDRSQRGHLAFTTFFRGWEGRVVSTEAVVTEASHLLRRVPGGVSSCIRFFLDGGAVLVPMAPSTLARCRALVEKYADLPMDFADATLVALGEELDTNLVFTTDRRDFGVYRLAGERTFEIVP
jgi:uncharacterized protein